MKSFYFNVVPSPKGAILLRYVTSDGERWWREEPLKFSDALLAQSCGRFWRTWKEDHERMGASRETTGDGGTTYANV